MRPVCKSIFILVLFLFSLCLGIILSELIIRLARPQQLILIRPDIYCADSLTGWKHCPNVQTTVNAGEGFVDFETDNRGFRINSKRKVLFPDFNVLFIGDSFIEAFQVNSGDTIPEITAILLENKYDIQVSSANAGVGDWDPNQYLIQVREELKNTNYDLGIIFLYIGNDIVPKKTNIFLPRKSRVHHFGLPKKINVKEIKNSILYPINDFLRARSHLFVFLKNILMSSLLKTGLSGYTIKPVFLKKNANKDYWDVTASICSDIASEFEKYDIPVLFVLLPTDYQVDKERFNQLVNASGVNKNILDLEQPNRILQKKLKDLGIDVIDPLREIKSFHFRKIQLYGKIDNHLNALGQKKLAHMIFPEIEKKLKIK